MEGGREVGGCEWREGGRCEGVSGGREGGREVGGCEWREGGRV